MGKKGQIPWNKGIPITEEQKRKFRERMVGRKLSEEHKKSISDSLKGIKRSEETIKKMKEAQKRREYTGWNEIKRGIHLSEEHKRKLSESKKGRPAWNKGKSYKLPHLAGENNPLWKGHRRKRNDGYIESKADENSIYFVRNLEHRIAMEKYLGRKLRPDEIVHHKNGIRDDNQPENLQLTTRKEHIKIHDKERDKRGRFK